MSGQFAGLVWKVPQWPARDQVAWKAGCTPGDPFDDEPRYTPPSSPASIMFTWKAYGRWLCFLDSLGWLDPEETPLGRVTRVRLRAYFRELRARGNADATIIGRFAGLERALRMLSPGQDVRWISRHDDVSIYSMLDKRTRPIIVPYSNVLFDWGLEMMDGATLDADPRHWLTTYRDGLLIAIFAARARRLRSMALLQVGTEFTWSENRYWIKLSAAQVKTKRRDSFTLPIRLESYVARYLNEIRPALLQGRSHSALWVTRQGKPLEAPIIQIRIRRLSRRRFGSAFGPHRFRHALATTAVLRDPGTPGLAAAVLDISREIIEQNYARAGQVQASQTFDEIMDREIMEGAVRARQRR